MSQNSPAPAFLLDANNRPVPTCNVYDESNNLHLYVADVEGYTKNIESKESQKTLGMIVGGAMVVTLVVFTLNFSSNAWTIGNLVTFGLLFSLIIAVFSIWKNYSAAGTLVEKAQRDGVPCTQNVNSQTKVFCSPKTDTFSPFSTN